VDDLNARLGAYGADVRTPNVDRLARLGRRFDHAYAQYSSCSPSRTSFLTGWRPERTRVWSNAQPPRAQLAGAVPLQEHFHAHGYFTARVGKVFHGPWEDEFHWDVAEHTPYQDAMRSGQSPARRTGGLPPLRGFAPRPPSAMRSHQLPTRTAASSSSLRTNSTPPA
jgi:arylsulfatase A-like enzyme